MPTAELQYSAPNNGSGVAAHNVDLFLTYGTTPNGDGSFTVTAAMGTYTVLNSDGSVNHVDSISLLTPGNIGNNDNHLFTNGLRYVDTLELSYSIINSADTNSSNAGQINFYSQTTNYIELDTHDMALAEGAAAESFLAAPGVRAGFDGAHRPDAATTPTPFAVRAEPRSPEVIALCERIVLRAGLSIEPIRFGSVRAWMDKCDGTRVAGWAQDAAHPDAPVCLDIAVDGEIVGMTPAELYRADIAAAGVGDGCHGFDLDLDESLAPGIAHTIELRRSADGLRICAKAVDAAGVWTALLAA